MPLAASQGAIPEFALRLPPLYADGVVTTKRGSKSRTPSEAAELVLRLDGAGWHPKTADPSLLLNLAAAYVDCLRAVADDEHMDIGMRGILLRDRCVEVVFPVSDMAKARLAAQRVASAAKSADGSGDLRRLRFALRALPDDVKVKSRAGAWVRRLQTGPDADEPSYNELVTLQVRAIRAGGVQPAVRFEAEDIAPFTLLTDEANVRKIGPYLYRDMEIEAEVERGGDDQIIGGKLVQFSLLEGTANAASAWSNWAADNLGEWNDEDIDGLIRRS